MAFTNVILHRYQNGWQEIHPKTSPEQIYLDETTPIGTFAINLMNLTATPEEFIKVNTSGVITTINATTLKSDLGAADEVHEHTTAHITASGVLLDTYLSNKADLDGNGFILSSQIPDYFLGGMFFDGTVSAGSTLAALHGTLTGTTDDEKEGAYKIATATITFTEDATHIFLNSDEGAQADPGDQTIEAGDYIVYAGNNAGTHEFAIINNTYPIADTTTSGIVSLSDASAAYRSALDNTPNNPEKVMDEFAVKQVIREIFYQSGSGPVSGINGDLWIEVLE